MSVRLSGSLLTHILTKDRAGRNSVTIYIQSHMEPDLEIAQYSIMLHYTDYHMFCLQLKWEAGITTQIVISAGTLP